MKSSSAHSSSFLHRWLSKTSNPTTHYDGNSDLESEPTNPFSPPPLTDSSSTAASSSVLLTPRTSTGYPPNVSKSSRNVSGIQSCTPPTKYSTLPVVTTSRAVSIPVKSQPSTLALTVARREVKLHRLLSYDPVRRALKFDISLPPSFIVQYPPSASPSAMVLRTQLFQPRPIIPQPIPNHDLSQLATTPPVTRLRIITDLIPWSIIVRGRTMLPNDPNSFVRVVDVLEGIYKSLREGVSDDEWNRVPKSFRDQVKRAYSRRCHTSLPFTLKGYEEKQGVRRVDYLKDKTMFLGLTFPDKGDIHTIRDVEESTWILMLAPRTS